MNDKHELAIKYLDFLFPHLPEFENFTISGLRSQIPTLTFPHGVNIGSVAYEITILLTEDFKYAEEASPHSLLLKLTPLGRQVKTIGGHFAYLKTLMDKENIEVERQKLSDEKLKYDIKNAKRVFKTYWWTFAFAIVGLIISLILAILKLLETNQQHIAK